ncbi:MAG: DMT family transporter [Gammaproteobacteria bacterium]|nr:DMT family transporter [Gammaproteobacteria bacterium]
MSVPAAYVTVIVIWSTTPLAIKWSTEEVGFLFGAVARMTLGFLCVYALLRWRREPLRGDARALRAYATAALGIYGAMIATYWAAQHVPSGWISLIFGLSPLVTAVLAAALLGERAPGAHRLLAQGLGLAGLAVIFYRGAAIGPDAVRGIAALAWATACHCLSAVLLKRQDHGLSSTGLAAGGLLAALPPYYLSWYLGGAEVPHALPGYVLGSIAYLGVVATTCGFTLYYYILARQSPVQLALITFVSPLSALLLGRWLNDEAVDGRVVLGAGCVLGALFLHEVWPALRRPRAAAAPLLAGDTARG